MNHVHIFRALIALSLSLFASGAVHAQQDGPAKTDGIFAAPHDNGVRRWAVIAPGELSLLAIPGGDKVVGKPIAPKSILTNFGCTAPGGTLWCEVRPLHGGPRGFVAAEFLEPIKGPDGIVARGINDSAKRAKNKQFDAKADILCAQEQGQELGPCRFGVARSDGGDVTAAVTFANGFSRYLIFMHGRFISASATMSGAGRDTDWRLENGVHFIRADDQRFEIPNVFLFEQP